MALQTRVARSGPGPSDVGEAREVTAVGLEHGLEQRSGDVRLIAPPVAGAALLGLDALLPDLDEAARVELGATVRAAVGAWDSEVSAT